MHSAYSSIIFSGLLFIFILFRAKDAIGLTHEQIAPAIMPFKSAGPLEQAAFLPAIASCPFPVPHHRWSFYTGCPSFLNIGFHFSPHQLIYLSRETFLPYLFTQRYFSISFFNSGDILILAIYYFLPLFYSI